MSVTYTINSEGIEVTYQVYQNQGPPGEGVPLGGTTGQILAKVSATDYDTNWIDNEGGGGGIPDAPTDGQAYVRQSAAWVIGVTLTEANASYDLKGSAFNVQGNLDDHEANKANPHGVTAAQAGAAPQSQVDDLDTQFQAHTNDTSNPHSVTAVQVGADPSGSASAVQSNLDTHEADLANPHQVSDAQVIRPYLVPQVLTVNGSGETTYNAANGVNATLTLSINSSITSMASFGPSSGTLIVTQGAGNYTFELASNMTQMAGDVADISALADGKVAVIAWTTMDGLNFYTWTTVEP